VVVRIRWESALLAAASALALSACWPVPGQNADRSAYNDLESGLTTATVGDLDELWSATTGVWAVGDPIVARGEVVASKGTRLHGVDARTGALDWTWVPDGPIPDFTAVSDPFLVGDRILVGYGIGNLGGHWFSSWLDPAAGTTVEPAPVAGLVEGVRGANAVSYSTAFGSGTPVLTSFHVVDHQTGAGGSGGPLSIQTGGGGGPLALTLGTSHAYHAGLGPIPPATPTGTWTQGVAVRAFPTSGGSNTCGPPEAPGFACATWTTPVGGTPTAAVIGPGEQVVYVGTSAGEVAALDAASGAPLWTAGVGAAVAQPPALAGGVLYVPTADGDLVAVAADGCGAPTCEPLWVAPTGASISTQPAVAGPLDGAVVYVGTAAGEMRAFAAGGCGEAVCDTPLWSASTGSGITGGPAVSNGRLYVGTADGRMIAYARAAP
jgi:outer membrane protein assembly factor BamB